MHVAQAFLGVRRVWTVHATSRFPGAPAHLVIFTAIVKQFDLHLKLFASISYNILGSLIIDSS